MPTQDQELFRFALIGLEEEKRRLDRMIQELRERTGASSGSANPPATAKPSSAQAPAKKRGMSVAARKRIADAQRARWAAVRAGKPPAKTKSAAPQSKRRTLSAEARERIADAQRRRWAAVKKGR